MGQASTKAERLAEMERLYYQRAYSDQEMAQRLNVDRSTAFRCRRELERTIPFVEVEPGRWRIDRTRYLSAIRLNLSEALALYLGARRLSQHTQISQPHTASALEKLALALRQPMTGRLVDAAQAILSQQARPERVAILDTITQAWVQNQKLRISYLSLRSNSPRTHVVSPYLIEPSLWSDSVYLIGLNELYGDVVPYKIDRIQTAVNTGETFTVPQDFDERELLRHAWGVWSVEGEPRDILLRFYPGVAARRLQESIWHPSQEVETLPDGGCLWRAPIVQWQEMLPWIRAWGSQVEVIEPADLRAAIAAETRAQLSLYERPVPTMLTDTSALRLLRCWGKTDKKAANPQVFHPALFHMIDVGQVARLLLSPSASGRWRRVLTRVTGLAPESLAAWLPYMVALHDIGKISAPFQQANPQQGERLLTEGFLFGDLQWDNDPYHALISSLFIHNEQDGLKIPAALREAWRDAVAGHHGRFTGREARRKAAFRLESEPSEWTELRTKAVDALREAFLTASPVSSEAPINISAAAMTLSGFIILCDWIGSDSTHFLPAPGTSFYQYLELSAQKAEEAASAIGFFQPVMSAAPTGFSALFPDLEFPRPLQLAVDEIPAHILETPCLAIMEAPTGEGKTEAALALAHRLAQASGSDEFYYALPTTATSNQMYGRIRCHLDERLHLSGRVGLVHGQAYLKDEKQEFSPLTNGREPHQAADWFGTDKRKSLLMPFGVGTIDQAELAALNVRFTVLRMIGLAGKVVILDEVHAYDTYMTTIVERLLNWFSWMGTSVILLSATLPSSRRKDLMKAYSPDSRTPGAEDSVYPKVSIIGASAPYFVSPAASQTDRCLSLETLNFEDGHAREKANWLLDAVADGGCVCWITNTVDRAQRIRECLSESSPDVDLMLIHSAIPLEDRERLERDLEAAYGPEGNRPEKGIVIGTQVLEQSLDLDFDLMVSDLAPGDLLLQRAGRLHRHANHSRRPAHELPRLVINLGAEKGENESIDVDDFIYDEYILRRTWSFLQGLSEIHLPRDYRRLVEFVYDDHPPEAADPLRPAWEKLAHQREKDRGEAEQRLLPRPDPESSFCGKLADLVFEEGENRVAWIVARTRLGEESQVVVPLEYLGQTARLWPGEETVSLQAAASLEIQKRLMRRSIRVSNRYLVQALKNSAASCPPLFRESTLLKDAYPLWLQGGSTSMPVPGGRLLIQLSPTLGLVIRKEKEVQE